MRVIGIDPGLQKTGYAVLEKNGNKFVILTSGLITTEKESIAQRLTFIYRKLVEIIDRFSPALLAVESGFYSKNVDSLIKMSEVKGVVILAGSLKGLEVFEYSPAIVKKAIVGRGNATKEQVRFMVEQITKEKIQKGFDVSDAVAIALCHLQRAG